MKTKEQPVVKRLLKPESASLLVICVLLFAGVGSKMLFSSHTATTCTITATSLTTLQNDVENATGGATVCVAAGIYGNVTVSGVTLASNVYLQPVPGATVHLASFQTEPSSGAVNIFDLSILLSHYGT